MKTIAKRHRPLVCIGENVITCHKGKLMKINLLTSEKQLICVLPLRKTVRLLSSFRVFERLLRTEVKTAVALSENELLISYRGAAYRVDISTGELTEELQYRNGMGGPRRFVSIEGVAGFSDGIAFGEYTLNTQRTKPSAVYVRSKESNGWEIAFEFEAGIVRHIHTLIPDPQDGCVYILTGDFGKEAGIWKATNNFKEVEPLLLGSQMYRSGGMIKTEQGFVYATDTALEQNYLYRLCVDENDKWTLNVLAEMDGSCVSSAETASKALFSTTVEADESIRGWRSWFNLKRGAGIKSKYSKLICVDKKDLSIYSVVQFKKDILPYKLFQYGYMKLLDAPAIDSILVYPVGVKRMDGKLLVFPYSELK